MRGLLSLIFLFLVFLLPVHAEERAPLAQALALQQAIEDTISRCEASVACILISRSPDYARFGAGFSADSPGQLGTFDVEPWLQRLRRDQTRERQELLALDLSHPDHVPESFGSGVVLDATGKILTNAHVVRHATKIFVRLPGNRGSYANILAADPRSDFAVLKLIEPPQDLRPIVLGDGGTVRKGQFVVQIANPHAAGFRDGSPSASWGIVGNVRRRAPGKFDENDRPLQTLHHYGTLLQIDTRITLGTSGGGLFNLKGEMIGLTTAQAALTGVDSPGGFAVPLDVNMKRIIDVLAQGKEVEYGFLGIRFWNESRPRGIGVRIQGVEPGGPASLAGIEMDDYLVAVEGVSVNEFDDLLLHIGQQLAGRTIRVQVTRGPGGRKREVAVKLAKYYVPGPVIAANRPPAVAGLRVDYTSILSQRGAFPGWQTGIPRGVVIREVVPKSPADLALLQTGKVIRRVNRREITSPEEFYTLMENSAAPIELGILDAEGREEMVILNRK